MKIDGIAGAGISRKAKKVVCRLLHRAWKRSRIDGLNPLAGWLEVVFLEEKVSILFSLFAIFLRL